MIENKMRPDAATGTTTAKRDYLYFMRLAEKFNKKMEKLIRDDFEEYVDQIKVATNGFELDKLDEVSIGHALISDALYLGLKKTIEEYKNCLR